MAKKTSERCAVAEKKLVAFCINEDVGAFWISANDTRVYWALVEAVRRFRKPKRTGKGKG